ncbi:alpha/beta hydrolase [Mucilaginibacter rubeus]|uniref:Alpha/beta hydrolase n=1 Tax=Mucilaginibacter rubeus TaxID=2027860 RepID=A0A5C1I4U2_9SPHI|nr:alpha/beta hydrolase [Mucilaginibacter rubeus]QEM13127.1 alpha/beta hydrolase [Mucilaginibacter rubeus]
MIRLVIIIILFLVSLLTVFKAFEYYMWMFAIIATEFSWFFILLTLIALGSGYYTNKYQLAGTILGLIALPFFISPIVRAYTVAGSLKQDFTKAFGAGSTIINGDNNQKSFSFWKMFSGNKTVNYKQLNYVSYADGTTLSMDFYPSQIVGNRACVIVVHGGAWNKGDNKQLPELNSHLALMGYNVAVINYRLAPRYQNPAPVEDVNAALAFLKKRAADLHIDAGSFVLLGRSAGAQIALLTAYAGHDKSIKGVIDYYGPADMVWGYSIPSSPLIMDSRQVMRDYIGGSYQQVPEKFAASSPLEFIDHQSPPTLIIHGDNDVLVSPEHSRRMNEKLAENGVKHFLLKLPWATHGFDFNLNGPGGQLATYTVERFLNTVTR